jgi:tRNA G18 (ribose-2'-O)-methylase SpoU
MEEIKNINDERIKEFISLRQSSVDNNYVVVESKNVFKKMFENNIKIHKVFVTEENITFIKENCKHIDFPIYTSSTTIMKEIVGYKIHQGMIALIDKPKYINFEDIEGDVFVLNSLTSPENVGSIVRSCAAFNINTLIIDEKTCSPFIRRCIRVSTGNLFNIKVYKSTNLKNDLIQLQKDDYQILSTANANDAVNLHDYNFTTKSAVIIGNEGFGIDKEILALSDTILKIDINESVTSLNASIAASIILYKLSTSL